VERADEWKRVRESAMVDSMPTSTGLRLTYRRSPHIDA
jgi:hypothetical protein